MWVLSRNAIKAASPDWAAQLQECWCRVWGRGECDDIFELSLFAHLSFKTKIHQPGSHYNTHIMTGHLWSLCEGVYAEQSALADVPVGRGAGGGERGRGELRRGRRHVRPGRGRPVRLLSALPALTARLQTAPERLS